MPVAPSDTAAIGKNPTIVGEIPDAAFQSQNPTLLPAGAGFIPVMPLGAIGTRGDARTDVDGAADTVADRMGYVMTRFKVSDELIDRLSSETGRRLTDQARKGRRRLLSRISQFAVTVTYDGVGTEELTFATVPTLAQIAARAGDEAFVVAIGMKRKSLRERMRLRLPMAAE